MALPCEVLSDDAHWLFRRACRTPTRKGDERSSGLTRGAVEKLTGLSKQELRELAQEIAREDLISLGDFEDDGHFTFRSDHRCDCPGLVAPVGEARLVSRAGGRAQARSYSYSYSATELGSRLESPTSGGRTAPVRGAGSRRAKSDTGPMSAHDLAKYLAQEVLCRAFGKFANPVNIEAVRKNISRWLSEGEIHPAVVQTMIDLFVSDPTNLEPQGIPTWKVFLSQRQRLLESATRVSIAETPLTPEQELLRWSPMARKAAQSSTG